MADINRTIEFTDIQRRLINAKLYDAGFSHKNWSEDDLRDIRKSIRNFYRNEQHGFCSYCKNSVSLSSVFNCHVEHIAPKSKYREFIFEPKNLCVICADCNEIKREQETLGEIPDTVKKGGKRKRYPRTSKAFKIVHPHFDDYEEHIEIFANQFYADKTEKGGYTILYCRLNRRLHKFGWSREIVDNSDVFELMNKCLDETNTSRQQKLLRDIGKLLLLTK